MQPSLETEVKLRVRDLRPLRRLLLKAGFAVATRRRFERNVLFDTRDSRLRKAGCLLRLRSEGNRHRLTLKGPPQPSRRYKVRPEWEAEISKPESLKATFRSLGLREVFRYEKYRTTYKAKRPVKGRASGLAEVDETPAGNYLELEGPARWIDQVALRLGYRPADYVTATYARLYLVQCRKQGIRPGNMVFRPRKT